MSANLHFELPRALVLSANDRQHWAAKARVTKSLRDMGSKAGMDVMPMERAHLTVRVGWPDNRRRDVENLAPTLKALLDGIVTDSAFLPDDSDKYLTGPDKRPYVAGKTGIVVLDFEFVEVSHDATASPLGAQKITGIMGESNNGPIETVERLTGPDPLTGISREQDL